MSDQHGLYWMSFADGKLPKGQQFLGVVILEADSFIDAISKAWALGLNPGGEVQTVGPAPLGTFPDEICGRLLSREEAEQW